MIHFTTKIIIFSFSSSLSFVRRLVLVRSFVRFVRYLPSVVRLSSFSTRTFLAPVRSGPHFLASPLAHLDSHIALNKKTIRSSRPTTSGPLPFIVRSSFAFSTLSTGLSRPDRSFEPVRRSHCLSSSAAFYVDRPHSAPHLARHVRIAATIPACFLCQLNATATAISHSWPFVIGISTVHKYATFGWSSLFFPFCFSAFLLSRLDNLITSSIRRIF